MNLRSVRRARSLWFVQQDDLNPRGMDIIPILESVRNRYQFQIYPTKPEHVYTAPNGIEFARGAFSPPDGKRFEIESMRFYRDGIVADSRHSTDLSDAFVEDLLMFLVQQYAISFEPTMVRKKAYLSELVVSAKHGLGDLSKKLLEFSSWLSQHVSDDRDFGPTVIRFGTDPALGGPLEFSFERQTGIPLQENRYFSSAPLTTEKHLEALKRWETVLAG